MKKYTKLAEIRTTHFKLRKAVPLFTGYENRLLCMQIISGRSLIRFQSSFLEHLFSSAYYNLSTVTGECKETVCSEIQTLLLAPENVMYSECTVSLGKHISIIFRSYDRVSLLDISSTTSHL